MPTDHRAKLATIKRFDQLIAYLRDEMGWPIARDSFEDVDDLFYDFTADELGIDPKTAAKIQEIKRLRPLSPKQPWGIFFVKFEPKRLPVVALRRILSQVALKKRASANSAERAAWAADDLLFVSNYGEGEERQISFAHFSGAQDGHDLPTLKVLGWDNRDTALHLDAVARELSEHLAWPDDDDAEAWRTRWRAAFTLGHREVVTTSKELSIRLAKLARDIRDRIGTALAIETDKGPLTRLMKAFQTALVHDLDADGFADMYAQTIAYGLLSARIADPHKKTADDFAAHMRTNPFLRELMETFLEVGGRRGKAGGPGIDFDELGVSEVVDLLDNAKMEAVVRDFGDRNPQEDPVIHFYELFLKEYDAKKRMQRGVFYTPRPVVSYIVRSVDELLRTEFRLADGLADTTTWGEMAKRHKDLKIPDGVSPEQDFVQILDPATGTGTFLVEVIDLIHKTLVAKWKVQARGEKKIDALWNEYVPKHLLTRLHGYELLMAPYAIAHLKIGLKLYETGYRFGSDERARVYLTNALEPPPDGQLTLDFLPALAHEAQAVNDIKRKQQFTAVIGNPPYSGVSANMSEHAQRFVDAYRFVDGKALKERKIWLQDDYVKFIRKAQTTIDQTGSGIVGYVTNHGYLDNPTFRGMRESLIESFARLRVIDLHGNANKNERSPSGSPDENVFDIRQGVAIFLASRSASESVVQHAEVWGDRNAKYLWLSTHTLGDTVLSTISPDSPYYLLEPQDSSLRAEYNRGWSLPDIFSVHGIGMVTARDHLTTDVDANNLWERVQRFGQLRADVARAEYDLGKDVQNWKVEWAQEDVKSSGPTRGLIRKLLYRPFDTRYVYYTGNSSGFVCRPVHDLMRHMIERENLAIITTRTVEIGRGFEHVFCTRGMIQLHTVSLKETNYLFPLLVATGSTLLSDREDEGSNISKDFAHALLESIAGSPVRASVPRGKLKPSTDRILGYIYAILHSPMFRSRYSEFLRIDFPRLPLPGASDLYGELARLGGELVALHLLESPKLAKPITEFVGGRNPEVEKISWSKNSVWIDKALNRPEFSEGSGV
jgi:Type ISP C-terminal specificity domain/Eco57I restriction-modification methylase